jgi:hypothetical protein
MFETLPRLQLSLQWMLHHKNSAILVDAWHGNSWSAQALELLGFGDRVVLRQAYVRNSVGIGFIPPAPPIHHTFPAELDATVQQLLAAAGVSDNGHSRAQVGSVLFIQRISSDSQHSAIHSDDCPNGVRMREVLNMNDVETSLRSLFGSRLVIFRSHGVRLAQQIKTFRNASLVIGVHGTFILMTYHAFNYSPNLCRGRSCKHHVLSARNSRYRDHPPRLPHFLPSIQLPAFRPSHALSSAHADHTCHATVLSGSHCYEAAASVLCCGVQFCGACRPLLVGLHAVGCC